MNRGTLTMACASAWLLASAPAHADSEWLLTPIEHQPVGSLSVAVSARSQDASGAVSSEAPSERSLEVRANYGLPGGVVVELGLTRPEVDDRIGHVEDWSTDRARAVVGYRFGRRLVIHARAGITAPACDYDDYLHHLGFGGSISLSSGFRPGANLGFDVYASGGNSGTTGSHGAVGYGMRRRAGRWQLGFHMWAGRTLDDGEVQSHPLIGGELGVARLVGDHWSIAIAMGGFGATRRYGVGSDTAKLRVLSMTLSVQRRFRIRATPDSFDRVDPYDPYRRGTID